MIDYLLSCIDDTSSHFFGNAAKVTVWLKLHMTLDPLGVVDNRHLAMLIDPQLANDNVVNDSFDLNKEPRDAQVHKSEPH